ncbi:MAG: site-specific integrase [Acidobacteria bacterium]|nr:site-specific integrase [Acidobacteriota bacterium]
MSKNRTKNTTNDTTKLPQNVFLRGGKWYVVLTIPTKNRYEGGRKTYKRIVRRCRTETEEYAKELISDLRAAFAQKKNEAAHPTVLALIEKYLNIKTKSLEASTMISYWKLVDTYIRESSLSACYAAELKPIHLQNHYEKLLMENNSADAIIRLNGLLFAVFAQGILWQVMERNPCEGVILPKHRKKESAFFSKQEARSLVKLAQQHPEYFIFNFLLETTMRPQEALAIRWSDIDLDKKKAHIRQAVANGPKGVYIKQPKTKGSRRTIPLGNALIMALTQHKERHNAFLSSLLQKADRNPLLAHMKRTGVNYAKRIGVSANAKAAYDRFVENDLVFPNADGGPWSVANLNKRLFKPFIKKAGLDPSKYSVKSLRHTSATILAEKLPPKVLQDRMGHADIKTTMNIYTHVLDESKERAAQVIEDELY